MLTSHLATSGHSCFIVTGSLVSSESLKSLFWGRRRGIIAYFGGRRRGIIAYLGGGGRRRGIIAYFGGGGGGL